MSNCRDLRLPLQTQDRINHSGSDATPTWLVTPHASGSQAEAMVAHVRAALTSALLKGWAGRNSVLKLPSRQLGSSTPDRASAEELYDISCPCENLDRFISHSWASNGTLKALAILDLQHRGAAMIAANLCWLVLTLVSFAWRSGNGAHNEFAKEGVPSIMGFVIYLLVPSLTFCLVFVVGVPSPIASWMPKTLGRSTSCFFDRVCIHQEDATLKSEGIQALGECVRRSDRLLVLWSQDYFRRLVCRKFRSCAAL